MTALSKQGILLLLGMLLALAIPMRAGAEGPVLQVLTVKVKGDSNAYLTMLKQSKLKSILTRLGATNVRIFRATLAGPESGLIFVSTEYPNLETFGKATAKAAGDAELQKMVKEMDASGIREIVSRSLLEDVTPADEAKP